MSSLVSGYYCWNSLPLHCSKLSYRSGIISKSLHPKLRAPNCKTSKHTGLSAIQSYDLSNFTQSSSMITLRTVGLVSSRFRHDLARSHRPWASRGRGGGFHCSSWCACALQILQHFAYHEARPPCTPPRHRTTSGWDQEECLRLSSDLQSVAERLCDTFHNSAIRWSGGEK